LTILAEGVRGAGTCMDWGDTVLGYGAGLSGGVFQFAMQEGNTMLDSMSGLSAVSWLVGIRLLPEEP